MREVSVVATNRIPHTESAKNTAQTAHDGPVIKFMADIQEAFKGIVFSNPFNHEFSCSQHGIYHKDAGNSRKDPSEMALKTNCIYGRGSAR